jgi:hypothetical protein
LYKYKKARGKNMDSRDFRKKWLKLQESWSEDANININSTKSEKLEEKRKLPDALKAHQFGKKKETDGDKNPESKDKDEKNPDSKKKVDDSKKKATEGKKPAVKGYTHAHAKQKVADAEKKKRDLEKSKKVKENTTSAAVGGVKGVCPDAPIASSDRLQKRKMPEKVVSTAKESKLFSHFRRYMSESGFPIQATDMETSPDMTQDGAMGELTGDAQIDDVSMEGPSDDISNLLSSIQGKFPGKKIHICVAAEPSEPFSPEDVSAAHAAIESIPEDADDMGEIGGEPTVDDSLPIDQDISDEVRTESCSIREDEKEDMGNEDGIEEIPTGDEISGESGEDFSELPNENLEDVGGISEASPESITMTTEQWMEFFSNTENIATDDIEGEPADIVSAGEGDDSESESKKSEG